MAKKPTKNEIAEALRKQLQDPTKIQAAIYKNSFYEFYKAAFQNVLAPSTPYSEAPVLKWLCDVLQAEVERIARGENKTQDIIINIPPRTSKSLICSVSLNAWAWTKFPHLKFICASYAEKLAYELADDTRNLIQSDWYKTYFPDVKIADGADQKGSFKTTARGQRFSTGARGTITGMGADISILDDPQKPSEANSEVKAQEARDFYEKTLLSRTNNLNVGIRIVVMQRLSETDLSGHLLEKNGDRIKHICLPAELSDDVKPAELRKYYKDGLLWPDRLGHSALAEFKSMAYIYAGQYMQRPAPMGGGLFKRESFRTITLQEFLELSKGEKVDWHFFLDTAYTNNAKNDPSALLVAAKIGNLLYIRDVQTKHLMFPELMKFIKSYVPRYRTPGSKIYIEGKANGQSLIQQLRVDSDYNIKEMQPGKEGKEIRANSVSNFVDSKRVVLIEGAYVEDFIDQLAIFPNGKNDDMVDALVYAIKELETAKNRVFIGYV